MCWSDIARVVAVSFLYVATAKLGLMYAVVGNTYASRARERAPGSST